MILEKKFRVTFTRRDLGIKGFLKETIITMEIQFFGRIRRLRENSKLIIKTLFI
jgi:hypothetical protein